jgi:hypothetical protein
MLFSHNNALDATILHDNKPYYNHYNGQHGLLL